MDEWFFYTGLSDHTLVFINRREETSLKDSLQIVVERVERTDLDLIIT